jgi:hypothetical protein
MSTATLETETLVIPGSDRRTDEDTDLEAEAAGAELEHSERQHLYRLIALAEKNQVSLFSIGTCFGRS